jgi:AcrR family transcriptional regulator
MTALPKRDRQAERREATRREIIEAAWEIARRDGLDAVTLRDVAARVGMQAPSLYSHFASKNAIYDAMFGQAWADYLEVTRQYEGRLPKAPRKALVTMLQTFVDFSVTDPARYQLMNQRMVAGFEPSPEAYAPSVEVLESFGRRLAAVGITERADMDLFTAVVAGLIDQQLANDPGGTRWIAQLPRLVDMIADDIGLPGPRLRRTK